MYSPFRQIAVFGAVSQNAVVEFGRFTIFCLSAMGAMLRFGRWCRWRLLSPQLFTVGVMSIPVVAITGAFIGMILAIEGFPQFQALGQESRLGGVINISVTKQIGPVLAAVMVAGRVGCALAAELGTMRVTEQLDAMRAMATNPLTHLVVPRVVACTLMTPVLTVYSNMLGVWGGWLITVHFHGVSSFDYWEFSAHFVNWWEITSGLIKSMVFGALIGIIACYKGFTCGAGASGVGRASTEAFVMSFLAIIAVNLVLAHFLNTVNILFIDDTVYHPLG